MLKQLLAAVVLVAMMSPTLLFGQKTTQTKKEKESRPNIITPKDDKDAVKARDHKHIAEFERLVAELHSLDMPRDRSKYKKLNGKLRAAMQRASAQARARSIRAGRTQATRTGTRSQEVMPGERPTDVVSKGQWKQKDTETTGKDAPEGVETERRPARRDDTFSLDTFSLDARAERMSQIVSEARKLHRPAYKGDPEAMGQNHALANEFLQLMRADAAVAPIDVRRDEDRRSYKERARDAAGKAKNKAGKVKVKEEEADEEAEAEDDEDEEEVKEKSKKGKKPGKKKKDK